MTPSQERCVIDEDGDVDFIVGAEKKCLRVSSKVLTLASTVFGTMFAGHFKEGNDLRKRKFDDVIEVPLPDDDATAMTSLCMAIHMKAEDLPRFRQVDEIRAFAIVCDKYDCAKAVNFMARIWIEDAFAFWRMLEPADNHCLVEAAWLLDEPITFRMSTKHLLRTIPGPAFLDSLAETSILPKFAFAKFRAQAQSMVGDMMKKLNAPFQLFTNHSLATAYPTEKHGDEKNGRYIPGQHDWLCLMNYASLLSQFELNVTDSSPIKKSEKLGSCLKSNKLGQAVAMLQANNARALYCRACSFDYKEHFREVLQVLEDKSWGLCLDCVKNEVAHCRDSKVTCRKSW